MNPCHILLRTPVFTALVDDKHYVGKRQEVDARFLIHKNGRRARFTKKYPPLNIKNRKLASCTAHDPKDAEIIMRESGIDNVRGGAYCQPRLPDWQMKR